MDGWRNTPERQETTRCTSFNTHEALMRLSSPSYLCELRVAFGLGHLIAEVGLLEARGAHPLVGRRVRAWRRIRRVQAGLDQSFARFRGDHGLQLPGGKRVDVSRLAGHQQQHLCPRQRGKLVGLRDQEQNKSDRPNLSRSTSICL